MPGMPGRAPARFPAHDDPSADVRVTTWACSGSLLGHRVIRHEANICASLWVVSNRGRIPYGRPVRDGVPLPGRSPTEVLSQLAYRVFGPLHPDRVRVVLDYHGLDGQPAGRLAEVAARRHVTSRTVSNRVAAVRAAGARLPLTDELIGQVTRASTPGDDHRARVRIAGAPFVKLAATFASVGSTVA